MTVLQQESKKASTFMMHCQLLYVSESQQAQVERIQALIAVHQLSIILDIELFTDKLNQKRRQQLSQTSIQPILLLDEKNKLSWLSDGLSVAPEWDKLQRRVVSAGRKSELLLQAAKVTSDSIVIDATAGFGHDSLILASTGAQVIMLEQQPLMALLLLVEQQRMSGLANWQKLMSRLQIINNDALSYFDSLNNVSAADQSKLIDVVYLDPMFPENSYQDSKTGKGAKVGKHMQALHQLALPPTADEELQLLQSAQAVVHQNGRNTQVQGRVVVKRPQLAPQLAHQPASESWHNEAVRFDGYFV
ncbi:MAG: 16S rRNA (guanine1516-N2)-methyltransferase [Psychrobacter glaciei]|jgi:16S rRNA (guanine1516-N2)-methyltransferase|uniref:Ribosomal RNA small subunit methyltransferase J n=1 Tax=Psychrobacter glaciei TaxID=619771 RepID=A0ABQ3GUC3_9GAMM|nr:class I SAM-dependent methyltransferase [Psychrobacter glaciei]GHD34586.1 ribosomal RNA small subunit methyltransferase J [Psychrobacter glaciei]